MKKKISRSINLGELLNGKIGSREKYDNVKIILMIDYYNGYKIAKYLKDLNENIIALCVHPKNKEGILNKGYTKKIIELLNLPKSKVFNGEKINDKKTIEKIRKLKPDIIVCI